MMRLALMFAFVALTLPARAQDIVIDDPRLAQAANIPAEEVFTPKNRSLLIRLVSYGCTRKARGTPEFTELSAHTGQDAAEIYCGCMAPGIMDKLTMAHVKTIMRTRQPDPALQQALVPVAQACMQQAGAK